MSLARPPGSPPSTTRTSHRPPQWWARAPSPPWCRWGEPHTQSGEGGSRRVGEGEEEQEEHEQEEQEQEKEKLEQEQ